MAPSIFTSSFIQLAWKRGCEVPWAPIKILARKLSGRFHIQVSRRVRWLLPYSCPGMHCCWVSCKSWFTSPPFPSLEGLGLPSVKLLLLDHLPSQLNLTWAEAPHNIIAWYQSHTGKLHHHDRIICQDCLDRWKKKLFRSSFKRQSVRSAQHYHVRDQRSSCCFLSSLGRYAVCYPGECR